MQDAYEHALDLKAETALALQRQADAEAVARAAHAEKAALKEKVFVSQFPSLGQAHHALAFTASGSANARSETSPWVLVHLRESTIMVIAAMLRLVRRELLDCCVVSVSQFTQIYVRRS